MRHKEPGGHALLFLLRELGFDHCALPALLDELPQRRIVFRRMRCERMLGGYGAKRNTHDRVGTRGENVELFLFAIELIREPEPHALALADPVLLHQLDLFGPPVHALEGRQELFRIG